jgi:hypothetical protein
VTEKLKAIERTATENLGRKELWARVKKALVGEEGPAVNVEIPLRRAPELTRTERGS